MFAYIPSLRNTLICLGILLISGCSEPIIPDDFIQEENNNGTLEVIFEVPEFNLLPAKRIHRAKLCLAYSPDSIMKNKFLDCANVSDAQEDYLFTLKSGTYYYHAAITCSAPGDSCMWGGFPGGRMGLKWTTVRFTIDKGKTTVSKPIFQ